MDKMFKRTLLGAAVALASVGTAHAETRDVGITSDFAVEAYGVAAISIANKENGTGWDLDNESRIGFRASKEWMDGLEGFMQIESGFVGDTGAGLGERDTFLGVRGDFGSVRFGRVLTPMYEIIDWPHANGGLGGVFDGGSWSGDEVRAYRDRHSDTIRYDGASGKLTYAFATGRGEASVDDNYHYGASLQFAVNDSLSVHGAVQLETDRQMVAATEESTCLENGGCNGVPFGDVVAATDAEMADTSAYLVGFIASLPHGFGMTGAYKNEEIDNKGGAKEEQASFSIRGTYQVNDAIGILAGYVANDDVEIDGAASTGTADSAVTLQFNHVSNGFLTYLRLTDESINEEDQLTVRLGMEYGF